MERAKQIHYFSVWDYLTRLIDMIGLLIVMYLSELLVQNMIFGGAVYLLGDVWATYSRLYSHNSIGQLPKSTRSKGLLIFAIAGVLTVALVFLFPYLQSKTTALVLVVITLGVILQQVTTEMATHKIPRDNRRRSLVLALLHVGFLVAYASFFFLNQYVVGFTIPPEVYWVYVALCGMSALLWICQVMEPPGPDEEPSGEIAALDAEKLMGVHAYRVYNKMAVNTFVAINLSIMSFICYMQFLPSQGFGKSLTLLLAWLAFIAVVTSVCMGVLRRRYLPRYDRPGIFLVGLICWAIAAYRFLRADDITVPQGMINASLMGLSVACMMSIVLEQSYDMKSVVELGVGHIDNGAYVRNTNAMLDWSRLMSMLLLLVMLTVASFLVDGQLHLLEAQLGMQRVLRVVVLVLPLAFILASMGFSLMQPLDRQYAQKLRKFQLQAQAGQKNQPLEARLKKILVNNYPRKLAVIVLKPILRPFMSCKVRGAERVDLSHGPVVFVVNHLELYGPIMAVLHSPFYFRPWIIHDMLDRSIIEAHMQTGIENMPRFIPMFLRKRVLHWVAPLVVWIMQSTDPIPVYRGTVRGVIQTIQSSVEAMEYDDNILLFPEISYQQEGVGDFFTGFVQVAKSYYRQTGQIASFYPVYINKKHRTMTYGEGIAFDPANGAGDEKERIVDYLKQNMNDMAVS